MTKLTRNQQAAVTKLVSECKGVTAKEVLQLSKQQGVKKWLPIYFAVCHQLDIDSRELL